MKSSQLEKACISFPKLLDANATRPGGTSFSVLTWLAGNRYNQTKTV
jgi:hypothetical protein